MTRSERIVDEIAGVLMGVILAGLLYLAMGWLWRDMRLPMVVIFVVFWALASVDTMMLRHHQLLQTSFLQWVKPSAIGRLRTGLSPGKRIWGDIAAILLGIIFSFLVAGFIGKVWPASRWPVFLVVFGVWAATLVMGILSAVGKE